MKNADDVAIAVKNECERIAAEWAMNYVQTDSAPHGVDVEISKYVMLSDLINKIQEQNPSDRQLFESWAKKEYPKHSSMYFEWSDKYQHYIIDEVQFAFEAWQASKG